LEKVISGLSTPQQNKSKTISMKTIISTDYVGTVDLVSVIARGSNPAIFLRVKAEDAESRKAHDAAVDSVNQQVGKAITDHMLLLENLADGEEAPPEPKPPVFTPPIITNVVFTHVTRLNMPRNRQIGLSEIASAFPKLCGDGSEKATMLSLIQNTSKFEGSEIHFSVVPQLDKATKIQVRSENGDPYFNVRLRSGARDLDEATALSLLDNLFGDASVESAAEAAMAAEAAGEE
jgi:hypothetical protein